jgi:hypothetical protein
MTDVLRTFLLYAGYVGKTAVGRAEHGLPPFGGQAMWGICLSWNLMAVAYYRSVTALALEGV